MKNDNFILKAIFLLTALFFGIQIHFGQSIKVYPDDGSAGDEFGVFVALSGDYALIGASAAMVEGTKSGAAYIFKKAGEQWIQQTKVMPNIPDNDDMFGKILSLDGDYALVTAYNDDDKAENAGAAYLYERVGENWRLQTKIYAEDAAAFDAFGVASDIYGDRAIIGAFSDDDNGFFSGSAYIFLRQGDQWIQEAKLLASDGAAFDKFGRNVSISDEYAVVCGVLDDDNGEESGAVYIFKRSGNTWTEEAKLTPDDGTTGDRFGRSVSIAGDYVAISAAMKDEHGTDSGSSYIFKRENGQWIQQTKLVPPDLGTGDLMGYCLTNSEDFMAISAHLNDEAGADAGAFYLFHRNGDYWSQAAKVTADAPDAMDHFGICVAISGNNLICGAPFEQNNEGIKSGAAYIYDMQSFIKLEEVVSNQITVFPNPVSQKIFLKINEDMGGRKITVYNVIGQKVFQKTLTGNSLGVANLAQGIYFFELETKDGLKTGSFVVER